jgi:hypothetical protein
MELPRRMAHPFSGLDDMLAFHSDFATSPHYLIGVPQSTSADVKPPRKFHYRPDFTGGRSGGWFWHHE